MTTESAATVHTLTRLGLWAVRCTPGCCGATVTAAAPGTGRRSTATHPDLAWLVELDEESGDGPVSAALAARTAVASRDLLHESRWRPFTALALRQGLRSCLTVPVSRCGLQTAVTLYAFRPRALAHPQAISMVGALAEASSDGLIAAHAGAAARLEAAQLRTALAGRSVIDQATGIVMRAVGCGPGEAFGLLRSTSQHTNRKLSDIAAEVVRGNGKGLVRRLRRPAHGPAEPGGGGRGPG